MNYLIPEWEKQEFVQLVFPHKNTDWNCCLEEAIKTLLTGCKAKDKKNYKISVHINEK